MVALALILVIPDDHGNLISADGGTSDFNFEYILSIYKILSI